MDQRNIDKTIGYAIAIIIGYYIVGAFIPMLTWGVIGLVAIRIYQQYNQNKK